MRPEESVRGFVRESVRFAGNARDSGGQGGVYLKDCRGVVISGNKIIGKTKKGKFIRADYSMDKYYERLLPIGFFYDRINL